MIEMNLNEKDAWSFWLGCDFEDFNDFRLHSNPMLNESNQIILLVSKNGFNISIPSLRFKRIEDKLSHLYDLPIQAITDIINPLKNEIKKVGYILYQACPIDDFDCSNEPDSLIHLGQDDNFKLQELKAACSETEWGHSCLNFDSKNTFGVLNQRTLVSASHYLIFPGKLASLGMITHPNNRTQGYAQQAAIGAVKHALDCGLMIHFQTLIENTAAIALSKKLGFVQFGCSCRLELN
ncbi:MAG: GNAT family N-acetyltransferase [Desulfobacula sp.]|nr:GNAT family N-acetyltransferase [Desulfobacula sp.]